MTLIKSQQIISNIQESKTDEFNADHSTKLIPFGQYLFQRIITAGTKSIFGVPGDFNLPLLEYLYEPSLIKQGLRWIGNCNELNAAYSADGFSRYSNKIGCVITTYGVGELSAINGIAGAFAENVKILHIVGVARKKDSRPNTSNSRKNLHHLVPRLKDANFIGPNHKVYYEMIKDKVSCSTEWLDDINTACNKVDKVIKDIYRYSKPGYIFVPVDLVNQLVSVNNLVNEPSISMKDCLDKPSVTTLNEITDIICNWIYQSKAPAIIGDVLVDRYEANKELNLFIKKTQIWNFSTVNGKSIIDELNPYYMGLYNGDEGAPSVIERFLQCDLILNFGIDANEINHGHYTFKYKKDARIIELHPEYIRFIETDTNTEKIIRGINFVFILEELIKEINPVFLNFQYDSKVKAYTSQEVYPDIENVDSEEQDITVDRLTKAISTFFNPGDVVVSETGAIYFAFRDLVFPNQLKYIAQGFYLSIGTALPATFGVGIAMQDYPRCHITDDTVPTDYVPRLILFEGDGSAQMTVQEMTSMLRYQVPVELFIWNNNGYTVERAICGPTRSYNDIMSWNWTKLFEAFGDTNCQYTVSTLIETRSKLAWKMKQLKNKKERDNIELMEVQLGVLDYPKQLQSMVTAAKVRQKLETMEDHPAA
ncbi:hypothetical protein RI543_002665 [Arxiozyma heterogenica]|uniref:Pyruvate decarboxylase n=1 Tax=Arxiozyma heterogenica TaxID=278026 RepID=A0AAN7WMZ5_9SACH|nr:hypothetical protein RI543_002665 [Kazachstania heterogenica]